MMNTIAATVKIVSPTVSNDIPMRATLMIASSNAAVAAIHVVLASNQLFLGRAIGVSDLSTLFTS